MSSVARRPTTLVSAVLAVLCLLIAQAGPAAAIPVPKGAYWYALYDLQKAWQHSQGAGITVAVVDTGVQASVGDLHGQTVPGIDLTGSDPGATQDNPKSPNYGHGTDMAAKIAGSGAGGGLVGIAPKAKILPVDAGGPAGVQTDLGAQGVRDAVARGAKIINLSIGLAVSCQSDLGAAVKYAYEHGVIVVASAGDSPGPVNSPANCPGALAVGGVTAAANGSISPWSQTPSGPQVDFVAPSYNLVDEQLDGTISGPSTGNTGTSAAAAFTSGVLALIWSKYPHESARQIVTRALWNVKNGLGDGHFGQRVNDKLGYGMILPYYALTDNPPATFTNPIYDRFDSELGLSKTGTTSTATSHPTSTGPSASPTATASSGSGGGFPTWGVVVIVVVVVAALVGGGVALSRRGRHSPPPPPYGP